MSVCQSRTTTRNNAFIFNLVASSPEGERLFYSFEFAPSLENGRVKINHRIHCYYSSLRLYRLQNVTHLPDPTSHVSNPSYTQESQESGK